MRYSCQFENRKTGERRDLISVLDPDEIAQINRVRQTDGDENARVTAAAIVLRSAYAEIDPLEWFHLGPPSEMQLS